jgi:hypothetical protein
MPGINPRHTITPDAFSVHPSLLGLPLARPARRLAAMLLDLLFVAILVHSGGPFLLGIAAAYVTFRLAARLTGTGTGVVSRFVRLSVRGFGAFVLFLVAMAVADGARDVARKAGGGSAPAARASLAARPETTPETPPAPDSLALAYAAALEAGDSAGAAALAPRLGSAFARDSLDRLRRDLRRARAEAERLEESGEAGVIAWIVDFLDEMGIGLGWTGLYFTAFLAFWRGQTPGKRLLGVRVLRLNGQPMTLWMSFERFGGYAAGLFTGLLGFAQAYWDPNRQMIHDKVVETVVVRERKGAPLPHPAAAPPRERFAAPPIVRAPAPPRA